VKRWPHEAQSGRWCPARCGSERPTCFDLERDRRPDDASGQLGRLTPVGLVTWTGASLDEHPGVTQQSPVAAAAADEQEEYSLDNSFLRS
jgi:hypothetical protein